MLVEDVAGGSRRRPALGSRRRLGARGADPGRRRALGRPRARPRPTATSSTSSTCCSPTRSPRRSARRSIARSSTPSSRARSCGPSRSSPTRSRPRTPTPPPMPARSPTSRSRSGEAIGMKPDELRTLSYARAAARHRQDRGPQRDPPQAGPADAGRVRGDEGAHGRRRADARADPVLHRRPSARPLVARALGRRRLSGRPGGARDPARARA